MTSGISFIIPCKDEEDHIKTCINSILDQSEKQFDTEIIVVDNGSTDKTIDCIRSFGEKVTLYLCPDFRIGELRNYGVSKSTYDWIAFIDADVEIDRDWCKHFRGFIRRIESGKIDPRKMITGSTCLVTEQPTWIERIWYQQLIFRDKNNLKYINSGNMVMHKELFDRIGGFKADFVTGEEEKLCGDAVYHGGIVRKNENLKAIHHGYPRSVNAFFGRMRWHGLGMKGYLKRPWKSRPLILALYNLVTTFVFIAGVAANYENAVLWLLLFLLFQSVPIFVFANRRFNGIWTDRVLLTFLYFAYGWAKVVALFDILWNSIADRTAFTKGNIHRQWGERE